MGGGEGGGEGERSGAWKQNELRAGETCYRLVVVKLPIMREEKVAVVVVWSARYRRASAAEHPT